MRGRRAVNRNLLINVLDGRDARGEYSGLPPLPGTFSREQLGLLKSFGVWVEQQVVDRYRRHPEITVAAPMRQTLIAFMLISRAGSIPNLHPSVFARLLPNWADAALELLILPDLTPEWRVELAIVCHENQCAPPSDVLAGWRQPRSEPIHYSPIPSTVDVPLRPRHWTSSCGRYGLEELTHPLHLVQETHALSHCLGALPFNVDVIDDPSDLVKLAERLHYWQRMQKGECRIFSFCVDDRSVATLDVSLKFYPVLKQVALAHNHAFNGSEPFYEGFLSALPALWAVVGGDMALSTRFAKSPIAEALRPAARMPSALLSVYAPFRLSA
jgi:hypothetical protein